MSDADSGAILSAPHVLEYAYRRSLGPVLSRFFTELRERRIVGNRSASGDVLVPPAEADPVSGEANGEFVEVGPSGIVTSFAWVNQPLAIHPLDRPFAFALIELDGATTSLLHVVDTGAENRMKTGMRVVPRWRQETVGEIRDIEYFEPEDAR